MSPDDTVHGSLRLVSTGRSIMGSGEERWVFVEDRPDLPLPWSNNNRPPGPQHPVKGDYITRHLYPGDWAGYHLSRPGHGAFSWVKKERAFLEAAFGGEIPPFTMSAPRIVVD